MSKLPNAHTYFLKSCPDWKDAVLFREWQKFAKKCFGGLSLSDPKGVSDYLIWVLGDADIAPKDRSKTIKTPIPIPIKSDGCPDIPTIADPHAYNAKVVQSMLRQYCLAHIRMSSIACLIDISHNALQPL